VSAAEKPGPAKDWLFVDKLLAEEELERIDKLSEKDVDDELRARGVDPARIPSAERLLAGAEAKAAQSAEEKKEKEKEEKKEPGGGGEGTSGASGAKVVRLPFHRKVGPWIVGLVVAGGAGTVIAERSVEMLAAHPPPDTERAAKLREEAFAACDAAQWTECARKLNDAKGVDPDGERDARVVRAREAIAKARGGGKANPR